MRDDDFYTHINPNGIAGGKVHISIRLPEHAVVSPKVRLHAGVQVYPGTIDEDTPLQFLGGTFEGGVFNGGIFKRGHFTGGRYDGGTFDLKYDYDNGRYGDTIWNGIYAAPMKVTKPPIVLQVGGDACITCAGGFIRIQTSSYDSARLLPLKAAHDATDEAFEFRDWLRRWGKTHGMAMIQSVLAAARAF